MKTEPVKGNYVPAVRTRIEPGALLVALRDGFASHGVVLSEHALLTLVAMSAHETAAWASCWNNNLGNVKASPSWPGEFTCLSNVWEVLSGVTRWFSPHGETHGKNGALKGEQWATPPGHPQTRFRSYRSLAEGCKGFVDKMLGMYRPSLQVLIDGGSSDAFIGSLKRQRYFTGDLVKYQASVRRFYAQFSGAPMRPTLRQGDTGGGVVTLQQALGIVADGSFGPLTHAAVVAFQRQRQLTPDGIVGPKTWAAIDL